MGKKVLRVAFPYNRPAYEYEPTYIRFSPEYTFIETVFSPLVEVNPANGDIEAGVADDFQWKGDELYFHIRKGLRTIDGHLITAQDAEFSLKRLIVLTGNMHGNIADLLCDGKIIKRVDEPCAGIRTEGEYLVLKTAGIKTFVLPMLAAIDFCLVPQSSVDPKTLKIVDYRNTSGPYYVASDDGKGHIELKANPFHYHYSKNIADEILLVPAGFGPYKDSQDLYLENKIDLITTIDKLNLDTVISFAEKHSLNLHVTMNLRTFVLVFTEKGLKRFDSEQRIAIGKRIQSTFREVELGKPGYEISDQLFPVTGDGALTEDELSKVISAYNSVPPADQIKSAKLVLLRISNPKELKGILEKSLPGLSVQDSTQIPSLTKYKSEAEVPDMYIAGPDNGYLEAIDLISYSIEVGMFGLNQAEGEKWLDAYMRIESKDQRLKHLRDLHLKTLLSGVAVPLLSAPYVTAVRPPWRFRYSQIYSNDWLWRITRD